MKSTEPLISGAGVLVPHQLPSAFTHNELPVLLMPKLVLAMKLPPRIVGLLAPSTDTPTVLETKRHESALGDELTQRSAPCVDPTPP